MATYQFLSDEWLAEARAIRAEFDGKGAHHRPLHPDEPGHRRGALRRGNGARPTWTPARGELVLDTGHIDPVDLKVSLDYDVAKAILVEGNPQAGMQAFMSGKIKVEGDIAKLMALQSIGPRSGGRRDRRPHPGHDRVASHPRGSRLVSRRPPRASARPRP